MKRLLLSACLVGVVFAGYPPKFPQTNQVTPATADPMTSERAVSIVPKNRIVQRVAFRPSATDSVGAGHPQGFAARADGRGDV